MNRMLTRREIEENAIPRWPTDKSDIPGMEETLLLPTSELHSSRKCANSLVLWTDCTFDYEVEKPPDFNFLELIGGFCRLSGLYRCTNRACRDEKQRLHTIFPDCRWTAFREWILIAQSCAFTNHDPENTYKPHIKLGSDRLAEAVEGCSRLISNREVQRRATADSTSFEVFELLYRAIQMHDGAYRGGFRYDHTDLSPPHIVVPEIAKAEELASSIGICRNRLWNVMLASPRGQDDMPAFINAIAARPAIQRFLRHVGHDRCTAELCEFVCENSTLRPQLHKCAAKDRRKCSATRLRYFPVRKLNMAVRNMLPTAWTVDSSPRLCSVRQRFMAISHVWSDGTGVGMQRPGEVNPCLFNYFAAVAKAPEVRCDGLWWDAICIPTDREIRGIALSTMHLNYRNAAFTLVHDEYLTQFPWSDGGAPSIAMLLSPWFTRGWTALELAASRRVKVIFRDASSGAAVLKDLDEDIIMLRPDQCSYAHWLASTILQRLRAASWSAKYDSELVDLLQALATRTTSWARDRMLIAGLLVGVEGVGKRGTQADIVRDVFLRFERVSPFFLFHGHATTAAQGPFSWCPLTLYDDRKLLGSDFRGVVSNVLHKGLFVTKEGLLSSEGWYAYMLNEESVPMIKPYAFHEAVELRIKHALQKWRSCLLLSSQSMSDGGLVNPNYGDGYAEVPCLLATVVGYRCNSEDITFVDCRYVGTVFPPNEQSFFSLRRPYPWQVDFCLGDDAGKDELDIHELIDAVDAHENTRLQHSN